jgi:hypothetical protein
LQNDRELPGAAVRMPHLSVVAVSRNDDHGGDMRSRMQHFVDGFIAQCRRHDLVAELILVEWNPPPGRPPLEDSLVWPTDFGPATVRIVTVPPHIHAQFAHAAKLPLFQMIGKNVGIRRAHGRFVLATNVDILFDDATVLYLRDRLRSGTMLRIDRYDVRAKLPHGASFDRTLRECAKGVFHVNVPLGVFDIEQRHILGLGTDVKANIIDLMSEIRVVGLHRCTRWRSLAGAVCDEATATATRATRKVVRYAGRSLAPLHTTTFLARPAEWFTALWRMIRASASAAMSFRRLRLLPRRIAHRVKLRASAAIAGLPRRIQSWMRTLGRRARRLATRLGQWARRVLQGPRRVAASLAWRARERPALARYQRSRWLHTNACGDFTLLAREDWARLRGYPEWPIFSWHLDSAFLYAASAQGVSEVRLDRRYRIYHLDHSSGSGWSPSGAEHLFARLRANGIPFLSDEELAGWQRQVAADPRSAIVNGPGWGLGDRSLPERRVSARSQVKLRRDLTDALSTCS